MNRATAGTLRTLKDGDGRWIWSDSLQQGQPPLLLGSPVVFFEDMRAAFWQAMSHPETAQETTT